MSLVMLPGLDGTGIMFRPIIRELAREVEPLVISYDNESNYQSLTHKVMKSLPEGEYFILGESFSGPISLMVASQEPKGLRGIILCATFISNPSAIFPPFLSFLVRAPLFYAWPVSIKANVLTGGRSNDEIKQLIEETKRNSDSTALASRTRESLKVNVAEELRHCKYPMLYLKGARDLVVGSRNLREIKRVRNDVTDVTINASHLVLQEAPQESAEAILKFIREST